MIRILANNGWEYLSNVMLGNLIGDDFCCYIQICQSLDYQNLFWLKKQFSSIRILSVTWISLRGTDKICLFYLR